MTQQVAAVGRLATAYAPMKVDGRKGQPIPGIAAPGDVRPETPADAAGEAGNDRVSVSGTARELAALRAAVGDVGAVRQEKVASLQAVMAKGSYSADPPAVAESVLRAVLADLLA
jgi:flagellar biosynthesis anti-sigma factor FlgM